MTAFPDRDFLRLHRNNLEVFASKAFRIVNPGQAFNMTGAVMAMAYALSEVEKGNIRRLLITVPPRSGKSLLASIALPAFMLGRDPAQRIICASYSGDLAGKLSRDFRMLMASPEYRTLFPGTVAAGKNSEMEFETAHRGFRFATSVGGTLTGRGGNYIIIDDPMNSLDAMARHERQRVWEWFTGTVGSRLDNKNEGAIVVVMQRLHVDDLAGRLLDHGGWYHLNLPAIAEIEQSIPIGRGGSYTRKTGEVLDPDRESLEKLEELKRELGSANFEAQYQQQPVPEQGNLVNWPWFKTYDRQPSMTPGSLMVMSWDTALKNREVNDYTVGVRAIVQPRDQVFIIDVVRDRIDYPTLRKRIIDDINRNRGMTTLIEDAGSGTSLLQDLSGHPGVIGRRPSDDKMVRLNAVTPMVESGQVHLPRRAPWLEAFKRELLAFPSSANDDQVDAFSQLLGWLRGTYRGPLQSSYGATGF